MLKHHKVKGCSFSGQKSGGGILLHKPHIDIALKWSKD